MKTKEEIEQLAEKEYPIQLNENHYKPDVYDDLNEDNEDDCNSDDACDDYNERKKTSKPYKTWLLYYFYI